MTVLRQALVEHCDTVRDLLVALVQVDSGIYDTNQLRTILQEPDTTIRMETEWLQSLLARLLLFQQYNELIAKWEEHAINLIKNLGGTPSDITQLLQRSIPASDVFPTKDFDQGYLRWVLEDTAQELDRLIASSYELLHHAGSITQKGDEFASPFFQNIFQITETWQEHLRSDLFLPISTMLQEMDPSGDPKVALQEFARYFDTIMQVASAMPMLVNNNLSLTSYSPQTLKTSERIVTQLIEGMDQLQEFVKLRSYMYSLLIKEQTTLLYAVLPSEMPVEQVLLTIGLNPEQSVEEFLPDKLPTDTLPLALEQAEEALTAWHSTTEAAVPYLNNALFLNQILQSQPVEKFLQADQQRLDLFAEWDQRIFSTFETLQASIPG
jgi:hypothetical protein